MQREYLTLQGSLSPSNPKLAGMTFDISRVAYWYLLCSGAFISLSYFMHLTHNRMRVTIPIFRDGKMEAQRGLVTCLRSHSSSEQHSQNLNSSMSSPKLQPSWPSVILFSYLSAQSQKPQSFTITFFPKGSWLFYQLAAFNSLGLAAKQADISVCFCLALKKLSWVHGWSLTETDVWKGTGFPQWPQMRPAFPLFSQWFYSPIAFTQSGNM